VVIPVGVDVEQPTRLGEGALERGERLGVATVREIRDGFEG
jgi:hypothetical protein